VKQTTTNGTPLPIQQPGRLLHLSISRERDIYFFLNQEKDRELTLLEEEFKKLFSLWDGSNNDIGALLEANLEQRKELIRG
jgi:hypothetical protein